MGALGVGLGLFVCSLVIQAQLQLRYLFVYLFIYLLYSQSRQSWYNNYRLQGIQAVTVEKKQIHVFGMVRLGKEG